MNDVQVRSIAQSIEPIGIDGFQGSSMLHSSQWAEVKESFGWNAYGFRQRVFPHLESDVLVLLRYIHGIGYLGYVPEGIVSLPPFVTSDEKKKNELELHVTHAFILLASISYMIEKKHNIKIITLRWDMPYTCIIESSQLPSSHASSVWNVRAHQHKEIQAFMVEPVQPPATVLLDITQDTSQLRKAMKQKARYNIELGKKKGLQIKERLTVEEFFPLYEQTSKRNKIAIHSHAYYKKVFSVFQESEMSDVCIYGAEYKNNLIAAIFVVHFQNYKGEKTAFYLYGASSSIHRNLMPAHALQWHAIQAAKRNNCTRYDLCGMSPHDNPSHRLHGLYKFKTGFGGTKLSKISAYDIVVIPSKSKTLRIAHYKIFRAFEKVRKWYYHTYSKKK